MRLATAVTLEEVDDWASFEEAVVAIQYRLGKVGTEAFMDAYDLMAMCGDTVTPEELITLLQTAIARRVTTEEAADQFKTLPLNLWSTQDPAQPVAKKDKEASVDDFWAII